MGRSAQDIVSNINILTSQSQALQSPANSINILSGPLLLIGQGPFPQIITGYTQVIQSANDDIQQEAGTQPFTSKDDEKAILDAYTTFVQVDQQTLNILIGKAGILNDMAFVGPPLAQVFRSYEGVIDTLAFNIIDLAPDVAADLTAQKNAWDVTIQNTISAYTPSI